MSKISMPRRMTSLFTSLLIAGQLLTPVSGLAQEVELLDEKPAVAEVAVNDTPNRLITTIKGDPSTGMAFNWYTTNLFEDAKVLVSTSEDMADAQEFAAEATEVVNEYGERDENGFFIYEDVAYTEEGELETDENGDPVINGYYTDENVSGPEWTSGDAVGQLHLQEVTEYSYKAEATELEPNTTYYYQVGSQEGGLSEVGTFTTAGEEGETFTFIQYTDTQNAYWNEHARNEAEFGANTIELAIDTVGEENVDFIMHTGDFVETAQVEDEWVDILEQTKETHLSYPFASAAGNHDEYSIGMYGEYGDAVPEKFNEHVNVDAANDAISGGSYYSYDYNGAHFVVLNSNDNKEEDENGESKAFGEEQLEWARQDIEEARANGANWVVLAYHKPIFSKSYHSLQDSDVQAVRDEFMSLIDELDVDLALQGHDHVVSATYPLNYVPTEENFSNGVVADAETTDVDGVEYFVNPEATVFVLPNTGGTKTYDDIYSKGVEHVHAVRPSLEWMTGEDVEYYNSLFAYGNQPQESEAFTDSHSNWRDSSVQNFAVYEVSETEINVKIYEIEGDLTADEERTVTLVHEFGVTKDAAEGTGTEEEPNEGEAASEESTTEESTTEESETSEEISTEESETSEESSTEESEASEESSTEESETSEESEESAA